MALAIAGASRLRPDIRLAQAVSDFKATLSTEQKDMLRRSESHMVDSIPDIRDVMRVTAEIDKFRKAGQRCFGPRLTSFLEAVQQFAAVGDVAVGGSQNIIACSVWVLVRMSILSAVNFSSYLDRISTLLMSVGRSAPRFEMLSVTYSRSLNLQSAVAEYFILVIQLCQHIVKFTKKSTAMQFASSIVDADLKRLEGDLKHWADTIKDEVSILSATTIEADARENTAFRMLARTRLSSMSRQQKAKRRIRILNLCTEYRHQNTWKQIRKAGGCTIFQQSSEYGAWKQQQGPRTLIFTGKLGSGKSVLLANIVDDLNLHALSRNITVAYFFCRHDIAESLQARTIFGCLVRQWLQNIPELEFAASQHNSSAETWDIEDIRDLLLGSHPLSSQAYFILDGLDELDRPERDTLIKHLTLVMEKFTNLRLCLSFRIGSDGAVTSLSSTFRESAIVSMPDVNPDIEAFIDNELKRRIESGELELGDASLILDISKALMTGSDGMFLWVYLQIENLCTMRTDEQLRKALRDLPKDLSQTYARILRKFGHDFGTEHQAQILELLLAVFRPLTTEELREALVVRPKDTDWVPERLPNNIHSTLACCGPLIMVDEEEHTVHLIHQSITQFLLGEAFTAGVKARNGQPFTLEGAHQQTLRTLLVYLSHGAFETQISTAKISNTTWDSAPSRIIESSMGTTSKAVSNMALKILKSRKVPAYDFTQMLVEARNMRDSNPVRCFHLYSYAQSNSLKHALACDLIDNASCSIVLKLTREQKLPADTIAKLIEAGKFGAPYSKEPFVCAAARHGKADLVKFVLETSAPPRIEDEDDEGQTVLLVAARYGHDNIVKFLLDWNRYPPNPDRTDRKGRTALIWASKEGHMPVVKCLLDSGKVDASRRDVEGCTCFAWACQIGHRAIIQHLLDSGKVDPSTPDHDGCTPIARAVRGIATRLLSSTF